MVILFNLTSNYGDTVLFTLGRYHVGTIQENPPVADRSDGPDEDVRGTKSGMVASQ